LSVPVFTWDGIDVTIYRHYPSDVPFLEAYLGNPGFNALYSVVQLLNVVFSASTNESQSNVNQHDTHSTTNAEMAATSESDDPVHVGLNQDISKHILYMQSLLRALHEHSRQKKYISWHNRLGHMLHTCLQELVFQAFPPKYFSQCTPPVCPVSLFAKQTK
jgi:hypothetical protein